MAWNKEEGALVRWLGFSSKALVKINDIELVALKDKFYDILLRGCGGLPEG